MSFVKRIREKHKLSQMEFSKKLGISQPNLSRLESGKIKLYRDAMQALHKKFKVPLKDIFKAVERGE